MPGADVCGKIRQLSKTRKFFLDTFVIELGLIISSLGTAVFYASDMGSSAMATFCDGLHKVLNMSYGNANTLANVVFLFILLLLDRKYIHIGTILCVFTIGPWVNLFTPLLSDLQLNLMAMPLRIVFSLLGTGLMGMGLGLYMAVDHGFGALEGLVKYIKEHTKLSVRTAKILQDAVLVGSGILLGATWGIGTLIATVFTGPILQRCSQFFGRKYAGS